jgi:hypothetical protein
MAHLITIEVGEGKTRNCDECPFSNIDSEEWSICGRPNIFPDCNEVDYTRMAIKASDVV